MPVIINEVEVLDPPPPAPAVPAPDARPEPVSTLHQLALLQRELDRRRRRLAAD